MFPLIAIAAFFILAIAFFAIGKDDFGIKRVKEDSNDTTIKEKKIIESETTNQNASNEKKEEVTSENLSELTSSDNSSN